jgi:hypothetical protein
MFGFPDARHFTRRDADHPVDAIDPSLRWVIGKHRLVARGGEDVFDELLAVLGSRCAEG